jgi:hypothetical protein
VKVRQFKLRALRAPRNPVAVALKTRRGGEHRKSNKALRRAANARRPGPAD